MTLHQRTSAARAGRDAAAGLRVVMLLENNPYPQDTRVRNEAEALTEFGHHVTVLAPRARGQHGHELVAGVRVRRYRLPWAGHSKPSYLLEYAAAHVQLLTRALIELARGADVVHFHGPPDTLFLAGVCAGLARRRVVFDLHDSAPELFQAKFGAGAGAAFSALRAAQRQAVRRADRVIVTNESQRQLVERLDRRSATCTAVVRNGPRAREFGSPPAPRAGAIDAPRLIYVGALDTQDGALELAELLAVPQLARATLTIAGDGPVHEELAARLQTLGVSDRVTMTGRVPHAQIPRLIAQADIGVDPAPGSELNHGSTMIKVLEYMGAGRPLVAYDLRETRRSAGAAALYAPCGKPLEFAALVARLASDERLRLQMGDLARQRALKLSWERSAQVLETVYDDLCGRPAHGRRPRAFRAPTVWPRAARKRTTPPAVGEP